MKMKYATNMRFMADIQGAWIEIQTVNRAHVKWIFLHESQQLKQTTKMKATITATAAVTEKCNNNKI